MDKVGDDSKLIRCKDDLKARLMEISHQDLPRHHHPLWQVRCIRLSYGHQVAILVRVHQSLCDGMGLMSLLVSHLADQAPPSTTTFIRTCNGTMTATNCESIINYETTFDTDFLIHSNFQTTFWWDQFSIQCTPSSDRGTINVHPVDLLVLFQGCKLPHLIPNEPAEKPNGSNDFGTKAKARN
jgi:hypothetical protein